MASCYIQVHMQLSMSTQSCQRITGWLIKTKQQRDSLVHSVRACVQSRITPPPPSISANRSASLWHTDIIAAQQKQTPTSWYLSGVMSRVDAPQPLAAAPEPVELCMQPKHRSVRHVIPIVNRSCKMEPGQPVTGSYNGHKSMLAARSLALHTRVHREHCAFTGSHSNKGVTQRYFHFVGTITRNGMWSAVTAISPPAAGTVCTLAFVLPDTNNSRWT